MNIKIANIDQLRSVYFDHQSQFDFKLELS